MLLETKKIISEIKRYVQDRPQVAVAYLMGSYAGGTATPLSDDVPCHDRVDFRAWEYLHHHLHLLADYALQVEDALERTVKR
ncbi:hypothetical protein GFC01_09535 [Desulfofundulus thermobenzoicus]|uniref:Polymerase nucleotidyl transferase domain-containing protein n=1 Tax=Desulfofundulus thermobenzoicus TaxID=29376 RepID=A0A6N7ITS1_9FIRM|nr:nucleotidyltransferase domain-containing protein [Desulfofundulus thermobenzoicus]MQL52498.1 hypothetical protein [Desulfofundulus thermobenzoicus]